MIGRGRGGRVDLPALSSGLLSYIKRIVIDNGTVDGGKSASKGEKNGGEGGVDNETKITKFQVDELLE